jgi:hypothetical protein
LRAAFAVLKEYEETDEVKLHEDGQLVSPALPAASTVYCGEMVAPSSSFKPVASICIEPTFDISVECASLKIRQQDVRRKKQTVKQNFTSTRKTNHQRKKWPRSS